MHGGIRKRGRPKAIAGPSVAYPDMSRREREHHRRHLAERLNDTDAAAAESYWDVRIASLALEPYGIQLIANDRVLHICQEWPQGVRRKVSGSVWDGRKLIWRKPSVRDYPHKLGKLTNGPRVRCAHRSWKSANQMIAAAREPLEPRGIDPAAADAMLTAVSHLATPQTKRANTYLNEGVNELIKAKRDQRDQELKPITFWRPWWQNSDYWRGGNGTRTGIPRCTGFVSANEWPIDDLEETVQGESWWAQIAGTFFRDDPYEDDPAADRKPRKTFLYRPGTASLQRPDVSTDEPFRAVARLWNWQINNRHREQMRIVWPAFAFHAECRRVDRPRAFPGELGGQCCRWLGRGSLPKKTCQLACWRRQK